jgi:amino acid permease
MLRSFIPGIAIVFSICLASKLDKVISILGALFGVTICLLVPSLIHYKLLANTKCQRNMDISIMLIAGTVLVFVPISISLTW